MKLYAYCVSEDGGKPVDKELVTGIAESRVRWLKAGELIAAVSEVDGDTIAITRDNILAHERVVRRVLEYTTPLPFRFGTLVSEARLQSYLQAKQEALQSKLLLVDGCVEMGVKIIWQAHSTNEEAQSEGAGANSCDGKQLIEGAGSAFLMAKRQEVMGEKVLSDKAKEIASWLNERITASIRKDQTTVRPDEKLVLTAAHLVERAGLEQYRRTLKRACLERPELHFLTSGPWPPYSFVNIELEFKTQFGVS
jgi:gas vesicle protein GvpL/GvpF